MKVWVVYEWDWYEIQVPVAAVYSSEEKARDHIPEPGNGFTVVEVELDSLARGVSQRSKYPDEPVAG